jgi:teichuronic acid biosynthesis glycosyltransferase TuaH
MSRATVVYVAGSRWSDVAGTDKRLTTALAHHVDVLWVDPPFSALTRMGGEGNRVDGTAQVADGIWRLQVRTPPGAARSPLRHLADRQIEARVDREIRRSGRRVLATVVASPRARFFRSVAGLKALYATDDWIDGASMMGLRKAQVTRSLVTNLAHADVALAVSPVIADLLAKLGAHERQIQILPNGCEQFPRSDRAGSAAAPPAAGLIGQLNERLDMNALDAVARTGSRIIVVGPRSDRDAEVTVRLDRFLAAPNVEWLGEQPYDTLPGHLSRMTVGLTPYRDTRFNRASFPLKTLEYLSAGLPVVSTDLPSVRWLDTPFIRVSTGPEDFAGHVTQVLADDADRATSEQRREFALRHTWAARADQLLSTLGARSRSSQAGALES